MTSIVLNIAAILVVGFAFFMAGKKVFTKLFTKPVSQCESSCGGCTNKCDLHEALAKKGH